MQCLLLIQSLHFSNAQVPPNILLWVPSSIKLFRIENLELQRQCNGSFGAYAPMLQRQSSIPWAFGKASCIFFIFSLMAMVFVMSFSKFFVPFIINLVSFIPIFHFFLIENLYTWGFFNLASSSLVRRLPIFLRMSLCSSIALKIFYATSSLIGLAIVS